ncbi:putative ribonuclease h protein [Quercus suber]|uniref:Ribonuclease h protein n=1 Tax=Quercus suber TaxID=58331 RepID=A0AAW0JYU6_QUESU
MSIPLCLTPQEDTLIWPKSKDGQYSVKLGCQLLCAKENSGSALGLKVPNKIKTFAWWACIESLPTLANLARRKVVLSNNYTCCNRDLETMIHALWGCEKVKIAWGTNFDELLWCQNPRGVEGFIMVCWFIYNQHNKIRLKEAVAPLEKTSDLAQKYLADFQQHLAKPTSKKLLRKVIWKPPDAGLLKFFFDEAVFDDLGAVGIGAMVHNSFDEVLAALFEIIPLPSSIVVLETIAARRAALFVRELGFSGSILEGDSEEAILAIKNQCF